MFLLDTIINNRQDLRIYLSLYKPHLLYFSWKGVRQCAPLRKLWGFSAKNVLFLNVVSFNSIQPYFNFFVRLMSSKWAFVWWLLRESPTVISLAISSYLETVNRHKQLVSENMADEGSIRKTSHIISPKRLRMSAPLELSWWKSNVIMAKCGRFLFTSLLNRFNIRDWLLFPFKSNRWQLFRMHPNRQNHRIFLQRPYAMKKSKARRESNVSHLRFQ